MDIFNVLGVFGQIKICMGKMLRNSNSFSSEDARPMLLKYHVEPPLCGGWGGGRKIVKILAVR